MASKKVGLKRLTKEYMRILKNPVKCVEAHPLEEDLFELLCFFYDLFKKFD